MPLKPFPIIDMRIGKETDREPWLLPQDAFQTLSNCRLKRGVLEKRRGRSLLGQVVAVNTATKAGALSTNPVMGIHNYVSDTAEELLIFDKERANAFVSGAVVGINILSIADNGGDITITTDGNHGFTVDEIVTLSGDTNHNGTYNVTATNGTDTFDVTFAVFGGTGTGQANQEKFIDLTRNKIRFNNTNQVHILDVGETVKEDTSNATAEIEAIIEDYGTVGVGNGVHGTIVFVNGTVTGTFTGGKDLFNEANAAEIMGQGVDSPSDEAFAGDNTQFFQLINWNGRSYITNGAGAMQKYDGTTLSQWSIDIGLDADRAGDNDITAVKLIFVVKNRIVLFSVTTAGVGGNAQRARWSSIGDAESWPTSNFIDAPTDDKIVAGAFKGDDLFIWFENSTWRFTYTGDTTAPFEWQRVSVTDGVVATNGVVTVPARNIQMALGPNQVLANDGRQIVGADLLIPDFLLDQTIVSLPFSVVGVIEAEREIWFTYADASAAATVAGDTNIYPNRVLVYNYEQNSWATYGHPIHVLGESELENDRTWDTDDTWEDIDDPWNARTSQSGFPTSLMGDHGGKIFELNVGGADDGVDIAFEAVGGEWNPFTEQGRKAFLAYVDLFMDIDPGVSFVVSSFVDNNSTAFQEITVTATAVDGATKKVWHRVRVGATGRFHRLKIANDASANRPRIHAIVPYFSAAGKGVM